MEFIQPNLDHRSTAGFTHVLDIIKQADIELPDHATAEDIAAVSLVTPALAAMDNPRAPSEPLVAALQEKAAWQCMVGQRHAGVWWKTARRLSDPYAASMAAAAAILLTQEGFATERVVKKLNSVPHATPMVQALDTALKLLNQRGFGALSIAHSAWLAGATALMNAYVKAVEQYVN